jgi:hypothetical protein
MNMLQSSHNDVLSVCIKNRSTNSMCEVEERRAGAPRFPYEYLDQDEHEIRRHQSYAGPESTWKGWYRRVPRPAQLAVVVVRQALHARGY